MPIPGIRWANACIRQIERPIERLDALNSPASVRISLRIAVGTLPAVLASLLSAALTPAGVLVSVALLYLSVRPVQPQLFELSPKQCHWHVSMPVHLLFIAWALVLFAAGRAGQIGRSTGPLAMAAAVSLWPVYMGPKAYARKQRRVPFAVAYSAIAAFITLQQIIIIGGMLA